MNANVLLASMMIAVAVVAVIQLHISAKRRPPLTKEELDELRIY